MSVSRQYNFTEENLKFCRTEKQVRVITLVLSGKTNTQIAKEIGITRRNVEKMIERVVRHSKQFGLDPDNDLTKPQSLPLSGASTLYTPNKKGEMSVSAQWVKTSKTAQQMIDDAMDVIDIMAQEIKPFPPRNILKSVVKASTDDLVNLHTLTDFHMGMFAEAATNMQEDWSTEKGKEFLMEWFRQAISQAPPAKTGLLNILGDLLHSDSLEAVTPASKHVLEQDVSYATLVSIVVDCLIEIIDMMLAKYEKVELVLSAGNHDESTIPVIRKTFSVLYSKNPRVTINQNQSLYQVFEYGKVSLFFHHGHKRRVKNIDTTFTGMYSEIFGRTKFRYAHIGHLHSEVTYESSLMLVKQHRTMAPKDDYASSGGYVSQREADVTTYHRNYGRTNTQYLTPEMVWDQLERIE